MTDKNVTINGEDFTITGMSYDEDGLPVLVLHCSESNTHAELKYLPE